MKKSETLLIFLLVCVIDGIEAKGGYEGDGYFWLLFIPIIISIFVLLCLCSLCCSKEEKKDRVYSEEFCNRVRGLSAPPLQTSLVYSSEKKKKVEEEDLPKYGLVVTSAQGGTFELYVPKTPKLSQVFPFPYKWDGTAWVPASTAEYQSHQMQREIKQVYSYSSKNPQLHQVVTSVQGGMFELYLPKTPKLNQVYPFPYKWDGGAWVPASKADVQSFQNKRSIHPGRTSRGHSRGYNRRYNGSGGFLEALDGGYNEGYDGDYSGGYDGGYSGGYNGGCSSGGGGGGYSGGYDGGDSGGGGGGGDCGGGD